MTENLRAALEAPKSSPTLAIMGRILPGIDTTRRQITEYSRHWAEQAKGVSRPELVALGDSLSQGVGASSVKMSYPAQISQIIGAQSTLNLSRSGARIADVIRTQIPALSEVDIDTATIVCTIGSNDITHSVRIGNITKKMSELLRLLPVGTVIATVPDNGSMLGRLLNRHIRTQAPDFGIDVADVASELDSWRGRVAADRFHPNDEGYEVWVSAFSKILSPN